MGSKEIDRASKSLRVSDCSPMLSIKPFPKTGPDLQTHLVMNRSQTWLSDGSSNASAGQLQRPIFNPVSLLRAPRRRGCQQPSVLAVRSLSELHCCGHVQPVAWGCRPPAGNAPLDAPDADVFKALMEHFKPPAKSTEPRRCDKRASYTRRAGAKDAHTSAEINNAIPMPGAPGRLKSPSSGPTQNNPWWLGSQPPLLLLLLPPKSEAPAAISTNRLLEEYIPYLAPLKQRLGLTVGLL